MADLAVTEAQVVPSQVAGDIERGWAGAAIAVGDSVYKDSSTNTWKLAQGDATATCKEGRDCGIAICAAEASGQPVSVQVTGAITLGAGAAPALGQTYVVSAAVAGKIAVEGDIAGTNFTCILGIGSGTNALTMGPGGATKGPTAHA